MITRRDFLAVSALAALGACSRGKTTPGALTVKDVIGGRSQSYDLIQVGTELLSGTPERVAFGIADPRAGLIQGTGRLWVAPDTGPSAVALGPFDIVHHGDGLPADRGYFESVVNFPTDGNYQAIVEARPGGSGDFRLAGPAVLQVGRTNDMPKTGEPAISVQTPTTNNGRGVDPICTRRPPCSLHEVSLAQALAAADKPVVVIFGTPAFCTSALCGPEVDLLQDVATANQGRAHFIHVELYRNDDDDTVRAQLRAPGPLAWKVVEEPATYFIGTDGIVKQRLLGPADRASFRDATAALLA